MVFALRELDLREDVLPDLTFLGCIVPVGRPLKSTPTMARILRALAGGTPRAFAVSPRVSGLKSSLTGRGIDSLPLNCFLILARSFSGDITSSVDSLSLREQLAWVLRPYILVAHPSLILAL